MRQKWKRALVAFAVFVSLMGQTVFAQVEEPVSTKGEMDEPAENSQRVKVSSECGLVMDVGTQTVLYEKNGEELHYPASITKLLTALVVMERCELDETVIFSHDAVYEVESGSGNNQGFEAGDKLTVEDCLYAMILESSNPAANALAEHTSGSLEAFVNEMNQKAEELGCENSNFENPSGLNDEAQKTTAYDMGLISSEVFKNDTLKEICSAETYQLPPTLNQTEGYLLHMEHRLVNGEEQKDDRWDLVAGKTGYTTMAGNTLVTYAEEDDKQLVSVVMQSEQTHYEDTNNLLNYGFDNYERLVVAEREKQAEIQAAAIAAAAAPTDTGEKTSQVTQTAEKSLDTALILKFAVAAGVVLVIFILLFISHMKKKERERRRREMLMRKRRKRAREMQMRRQQDYQMLRVYERSGR